MTLAKLFERLAIGALVAAGLMAIVVLVLLVL